jgi:release factor glutamine methyltransferase
LTVREVLQRSASWLADKGFESARLEAELLLAHVLEAERLDLYTDADRPLTEPELDGYRALLRRRADGEPVAYLTGTREFYGLAFRVTSDVLVPRPETELIVDRARELRPASLLDVGTGSGCIAIASAVRLPDTAITAIDVSLAALEVARSNAAEHGVAERVRFLAGDLFGAVPGETFELIACNPPYVASGTGPPHEPDLALYGGADGLDLVRRVLAEAPAHLAPGGRLLVEIGDDQAEATLDLARARFPEAEVRPDLAGLPRVLEAQAAS